MVILKRKSQPLEISKITLKVCQHDKEKIKMAQVMGFKLSTGEEVIGSVDDENQDSIFVKSPMIVQVMSAPGGGFGVGLIPFVITKRSGAVEIKKLHIVSPFTPDKDSIDAYQSQTSGIQIASAGSVLTG
jgi:hypothetical protein